MIDHLVGRPNPSWKRTQVFLVILFWLWRIVRGASGPPRILFLPRANRALQRFTPWQIILSTLTTVYALRNLDHILGLTAPEPLARLYSASYYRATWIVTGLDAGFATAMSIRPKWLRDIASIIFTIYYIIFAQEADEKLRRFRAVPTVEMLRTTWEKTTNPYIRFITNLRLPRLGVRRKILLPRPNSSSYDRPITAYLYFAPPESELANQTELILDFPGGGFVAMTPEHHEERLRMWAVTSGRPVLAIDYGKAPEYPYPFAIDEAFDTYRVLVESNGSLIGMSGRKLSVVICGDSAGGTLAVNVVVRILELRNMKVARPVNLPLPIAVLLSYPALDFNFTSWMSPENLRVLRSEQSSGDLPGLRELAEQKDHLKNTSPLSMVRESKPFNQRKKLKRKTSWKDKFRGFASGGEEPATLEPPKLSRKSSSKLRLPPQLESSRSRSGSIGDEGNLGDAESEDEENFDQWREEDKPIRARVKYKYPNGDGSTALSRSAMELQQYEMSVAVEEANSKATQSISGKEAAQSSMERAREPIGTRLTMTSRTGYFQDRIISPSMMRAMAILYIGPHRNPDFGTDYRISPLLTPDHLLAQFPPLLLQCGEKDPFVDDTVIFAGRVREAKRARKAALDLALSGKSARFGETLRMSSKEVADMDGKTAAELKRERDRLASQSESDWVQMVLFSDWSHGYLQMPTLMSEAKAVIEDLAEWIDDAFTRYKPVASSIEGGRNGNGGKGKNVVALRVPSPPTPFSIPPPSPSPLASETETDGDTAITLVPKRLQEQSRRSSAVTMPRPKEVKTLVKSSLELSDSSETIVGSSSSQSSGLNAAKTFKSEVGTPEKASTPRLTGQTITESELMQRRRLQDSHLFEQKP
ncbi:hormone-sensitive lipase [Coprinopsis cinerea okayama7|uniref:Hormone-sensitive lipase n=1 Tax=Coprinopsis cinerea (strain Okayama-7 / 130 / ATCC MYA-4618 / FGSC 9003) TaxID=240176 RepID=A8N5A4_COPC7|nr:hormone-sensitive lipase [Coprinopsis cinerea okayama7\|eukprot:XP_001830049.1 hormone-sensitive lipase [Coprinopsis cinerea okayama7\